jgi:subtilisin family serine protease
MLALALVACDTSDTMSPPVVRTLSPANETRRYVVVLNDTVTDAPATTARLMLRGRGLTSRASFDIRGGNLAADDERTFTSALRGFSQTLSDAAVADLRADPRVAYVELDQIGHIDAMSTQPNATWSLDRIDQRALPLNNGYAYAQTGNGVRVYIFDTGIRYSHADFGGRARLGIDVVTPNGDGADCHGHGTHVAGTVGGSTYGVAKNVALYSVRVMGCSGSGNMSHAISGLDWVIAQKQASPSTPMVVNMSIGSEPMQAMDDAVTRAVAAGIVVVAAAGNDSTDACTHSPARAPKAITVGATARTDEVPAFSNTGRCVDLFAPGVGISSAYFGADNQFAIASGTSMAAPAVSGAAALYLEANAGATAASVGTALVSNATSNALSDLRDPNAPNKLLYTGFLNGGTTGGGGGSNSSGANASFTMNCAKLACTFDAGASTGSGKLTYTWKIGSVAATGVTVKKTMTSPAAIDVRLIIKDAAKNVDTVTQQLSFADAAPVAKATASCKLLVCTFSSTTSTDDYGITSLTWQYGNGKSGTAKKTGSVSYTYATSGTYTATLIVADVNGQADTTTVSVSPLDNPPTAAFTATCTKLVCKLDAKTSTDDGAMKSWAWTYGNNKTGTGQTASVTYAAKGTYTIGLTVTDAAGQTATTSKTVTVNP